MAKPKADEKAPPSQEPASCSNCLFFDVIAGNLCRGVGPTPSTLHGAAAVCPVVSAADWCKGYMAIGSAWP